MKIKRGDIVKFDELTPVDIVDYILNHEQDDDLICRKFNYYGEAVALTVKRNSVIVALYDSSCSIDFFFIIEIKRRIIYDVVSKKVDSPKTVCVDNWFWIVAGNHNDYVYMFSYLVYKNSDYEKETLSKYITENEFRLCPGAIKIKNEDFKKFAITLYEDHIADDFIFKKFNFDVLIMFDNQIPEFRYNSEIDRWERTDAKYSK